MQSYPVSMPAQGSLLFMACKEPIKSRHDGPASVCILTRFLERSQQEIQWITPPPPTGWTITLYQNNFKRILHSFLHFSRAKDVISHPRFRLYRNAVFREKPSGNSADSPLPSTGWTTTLYQNNLKNIAFFITFF